jgi:hypothetical protein
MLIVSVVKPLTMRVRVIELELFIELVMVRIIRVGHGQVPL